MVATVVLVPVADGGCEPVPIQLAKFKQVLGECLGNSARVEIQRTMPDAAPETHVYRVVHSQEAGVRAGSRVAGPNVIEFVPRRYEHCQNAMLVYFEEGTDRLQWFGARKVVAAVARQCRESMADSNFNVPPSAPHLSSFVLRGGLALAIVSLLAWLLLKIASIEDSQKHINDVLNAHEKRLDQLEADGARLDAAISELARHSTTAEAHLSNMESTKRDTLQRWFSNIRWALGL